MSSSTAADPAIGTQDRARQLLSRARQLTTPLMRTAVDTLPAELRLMAGYHLGWCEADGTVAAGATGKGLRPALVLAAAAAVGGPPTAALHAAAAVEMVHNFTVIHDEVMDRDAVRRGRPTVWRLWGADDAVLVGDALHSLAIWTLAEAPDAALAGIARLEDAVIELCLGQHHECAHETWAVAGLDAYLETLRHRAAVLFGCACAMGALCAGAPSEVVAAMDRFGRELGIAAQLSLDPPAGRAAELIARAGGKAWARAESARRLRAAAGLLAGRPAEDLLTLADGLVGAAHR
ncbi:polyprenyl synthetase family protein [Nocardia heshunensis]